MRIRWDIVGAALAVPGFVVIASFIALGPLVEWAGCAQTGLEVRCPATPSGSIAGFAGQVVALTLVFSFIGVGIVPPVYSALWLLRLLLRRFSWPVVIGVFLGLAFAVGAIGRLAQEHGRDTLIGLSAFAVVGALIWRAVRRRRAAPPQA